MIKIIYTIPYENKEAELSWLNTNKVYPSCLDLFLNKKTMVGVIVNPETALVIGLRHRLDSQTKYIP